MRTVKESVTDRHFIKENNRLTSAHVYSDISVRLNDSNPDGRSFEMTHSVLANPYQPTSVL